MAILDFPQDTSQSPYVANGVTYVWDGQKWTASIAGSGGDSVSVHVGTNPPTGTPSEGDLWWHDEEARLYVYYLDDDSGQWVDASPGGGSGGDEYTLPVATDTVLGGIKVGSRLTIAGDGTLSADIQGGGGTTVGNLQEVTDVGNTTTNDIEVGHLDCTGMHANGAVTGESFTTDYITGFTAVVRPSQDGVAFTAVNADNFQTETLIIEGDGTVNIGGTLPASPNISLNANGNIFSTGAIATTRFTFTSQLASQETVGGETKQFAFAAKDEGSVYKVTIDYSGNVALGDDAWSTPNIYLKATDGSASFGAGNISLNANGSASFAGKVDVTGGDSITVGGLDYTRNINFSSDGTGGMISTYFDGALTRKVCLSTGNNDSSLVLSTRSGGANNESLVIDSLGNVTTAGTVNGVNVANVGSALTSLKTAAASATDLDALKAAIATALANF